MPATKSLRSGTCASTLLPTIRSARRPSATQRLGQRRRRRTRPASRCPCAMRDPGDVGRRLDAEHRDAERQEVLQQVAVVARELDHEAVRPEPEPRARSSRSRPWRGRPRSSSRRRSRRTPGRCAPGVTYSPSWTRKQLAADQHVQREVGLHRVELIRREEALAQRRHAEIDEAVLEARAAQPAGPRAAHARIGRRCQHLDGHRRSPRLRPAGSGKAVALRMASPTFSASELHDGPGKIAGSGSRESLPMRVAEPPQMRATLPLSGAGPRKCLRGAVDAAAPEARPSHGRARRPGRTTILVRVPRPAGP